MTERNTSSQSNSPQPVPSNDFANEASEATPGLLREIYDFLRDYRVWWLTPLVVVLLLLAGLVFLSGTAAAPFIYPLF